MSLLMEALKKAEEAKRKAGESSPAQADDAEETPTLLPMDDYSFSASSQSGLEQDERDFLLQDDEPAAPPPSSRQAAPPRGSKTAEQNAAHNLFAAKQPAQSSSNSLWLLACLGLLAALLIAGYFWWKLQEVPSQGLALKTPVQPAAALTPPPAKPASAPVSGPGTPRALPAVPAQEAAKAPEPSVPVTDAQPALQSAPPSSRPALPSAAASVSGGRSETSVFSPPAARPSAKPPTAKERTPTAAAPRATAKAMPDASDVPLRMSRTAPRVNPLLDRAYDQLQAGLLDEAQKDYEQVLRGDGKNVDALLGMATIAQQKNQIEKAHAYYQRALESDPSNPTAQAAVIHLRGQANADASESRLKSALSSQPGSPALLFALGNLYAGQGRWSEAQQIYFQAYAIEPDNPDFIFNLAISLDHLHQGKLAAQYYGMALSASETRPASFNREQARNRIQELRPQ